jgi:hypothetical protein
MENSKQIIKAYLPDIIDESNKRFQTFKSAIDYDALSTKLKSELISNLLEASFKTVVPNTVAPLSDREPDLYLNKKALEIKTAKTSHTWRSGTFTKRESDYLLVSYDDSEGELKWFFLFTNLIKEDWEVSKSDSYYATTINLDWILENKEHEIIQGNTQKKRIKRHLVCK